MPGPGSVCFGLIFVGTVEDLAKRTDVEDANRRSIDARSINKIIKITSNL